MCWHVLAQPHANELVNISSSQYITYIKCIEQLKTAKIHVNDGIDGMFPVNCSLVNSYCTETISAGVPNTPAKSVQNIYLSDCFCQSCVEYIFNNIPVFKDNSTHTFCCIKFLKSL